VPPPDDFSSLFEFLPIGAYRSTPDGRQLRANPALARLNGFESEAEQVEAVRDIAGSWYVDPARRAQFIEQMQAHGRVVGFESEVFRYKSRERIWINENAHAVRDAEGRVLYYEGTIEEITDRVRDRQALQDSREQLQQIVDVVPGALYRVEVLPDGERRTTFVSPRTRELFGIGPEQVMGALEPLNRMRHPEDALRVQQAMGEAAATRRALHIEYRVVLADGRTKWIEVYSEPVPAAAGRQVRVGLALDISARKRAEEALRDNGELWKRALESTGDGAWDWHGGDHVEFSDKCLALYGFARGELPDTPDALDARTHEEDRAAMEQARRDHLEGRTPVYVNEHRVLCKDGRWKWVLSRGVVISRDEAGRPLRMIGTHTDITTRKLADELRLERDSAAAADRAKSQFLSRVSHELRTPLNAILGFSQLLEMEATLDARQRGWVGQVLASGRHLLGLMDDILDLSSAQTGQLPVAREALALPPVLDEVWTMLAAGAADAGVVLDDSLAREPTLAVVADRKRLKQVLANVIGNAVKYNRRGGRVRLRGERVDDTVLLHVADDGAGFTADQRERLFQPFERLGASRGEVPGTGLGLALSRQLMEAMGGSIGADSTPGVGSVFTLRLPAADPPERGSQLQAP
jgi:PAS domain S-box-containing protein